MSVMYIVLPLALFFAAVFVGLFIWAVRHGQMDDLQTPAARMLLDDDDPAPLSDSQTKASAKNASPPTADTAPDKTASR